MTFATGFGMGLLVLPLAYLCAGLLGGTQAAGIVALALTAGAAAVPPVSGKRIAGVATGLATFVVGGFALLVVMLSGAPLG